MDFTADGLITLARDFGFLPTFDEGDDTRLLRLLNRSQLSYLAGIIEAADASYRYATYQTPVISGQLTYVIPPRAIANGIEMIEGLDSSGNAWLLTELRPRDWTGAIWVAPGRQFYLERSSIVFYAEPPAGTLLVRYPLRMSELVLSTDTSAFRTISTLNTSTDTVTLSGTYTNAAGVCDLIQATPPFEMLDMDSPFTGSGTSTLVFTDGLPVGLAVGDYVCQPKKSPVCLAPLEMHELLAMHVAWMTLTAKGDTKAQALESLRDDTKKRVMTLLAPRPAKPRAIKNFSAPGWRGYAGGWRGGSL